MTQIEQMGKSPERSGHQQITQITAISSERTGEPQMSQRTHCLTGVDGAKLEVRCQMREDRSKDADRRGHPQITQITQIGVGAEFMKSVKSAESAVRNPESGNL
jgi:hypothetical protein